jgi:hypothetical protein
VWEVRFIPAARAELIYAQEKYEAKVPGLGPRFRAEIDRTVQRMASNPKEFPLIYKNVRRARVNVFPYALFFCMEADALSVIACFHGKRDPRHWQGRV